MNRYLLPKHIMPLLLLFAFAASCNGQNTTVAGTGKKTAADTTAYGPGDIVQCAFQDKAGNIWLGKSGGQGLFCYDGKTFVSYTGKKGWNNRPVYAMEEDRNGSLWIGTDDGVYRYDGKTFTAVPIPVKTAATYAPGAVYTAGKPVKNVVTDILEDKAGNLWLGTLLHGIYRYNGKTFDHFLAGEDIRCITEDRAGNIWVGSWSNRGAYHYSSRQAAAGFVKQDGLTDGMIACIYEDRSGDIWFGTRDKGLCRYDGRSFTYYSEQNGLCNNNISFITSDNAGNLWFSSTVKYGTKSGGLCRYDGKTFKPYSPMPGLENNDIFFMLWDRNGPLWCGGRYGRLYSFDGKIFRDQSARVH